MAQQIKNFLVSLIPHYEPWKMNLIQNWNNIVGDLHTQMTLINIQQHQLVLGVYDAAWLQELYILSPVLIKTMNSYLGNDYITTIRFKNIGYPRKEKTTTVPLQEKAAPDMRKRIPLTSGEEMALAKITDVELSNAIKEYLNRCKE